MGFLGENIGFIQHIQVSQCPNRDEPCNAMEGDLNYSKLYAYLDKILKYSGHVGLEYKPQNKNYTTKGLRLDNDWFGRFNVKEEESKEDGSDKSIDEETVAKKILDKSLLIIANVLGDKYTK